MSKQKIIIHLENFSSTSPEAYNLNKSKQLGELKNKKILYSSFEIIYLLEKKLAITLKNNKSTNPNKILKRKQKNLNLNYTVFKNLRNKGYIVKSGLKFGSEFRIYNKSNKHAIWLVHITNKNKISTQDFISKNRIANATNKKLLLAIIDDSLDITYYEINWIKP